MSDLTVGSIPQHIRKLAVPTSVGFFFHTMYNVVDTFYAGLLSTEALAALSLSFPVFFLIIAVAVGIGAGATALVSNALGAKNPELAKLYLAQAITYAAVVSLVLFATGIIVSRPVCVFLGADGSYLDATLIYLHTLYFGSCSFVLLETCNAAHAARGNLRYYRNVMVGACVLNIFLNPWLMYGGLGVPALGFRGIALATVCTETLGFVYIATRLSANGYLSRSDFVFFKPRLKVFWEISTQSVPAIANMLTVAGGIFVIMYFVGAFGQEAVAGYGIGVRIEQMVLLPAIGLNVAALAIVGQNNGAGRIDRIRETFLKTNFYGLLISVAGGVLVYFFAADLCGLFTGDERVIEAGSRYLFVSVFIFWAYSALFIANAILQGMKRPMMVLAIGLFRQLFGLAASIYLFVEVLAFELSGVWWGILVVTWASALFCFFYISRLLEQIAVR